MQNRTIHQDIAAVGSISAIPAILKVMAELTGMRVSLVARVTADSWTACAVYDRMEFGLAIGDQLDVATTLCKEVCESHKAIVIEDATNDPFYKDHRTPKLYKIESYIAIPIVRPSGELFGTLCAIDRNPTKLDAKVVASLELFSELISRQLGDEEVYRKTARELDDERELGRLRERFVAVLGHDLRTPLGGISISAEALIDDKRTADELEMLQGIKESCIQMSEMIVDVMDFARARLGGGISVDRSERIDVSQLTTRSIDELSLIHGGHSVQFGCSPPVKAWVDEGRFRQLLSNLIGNALQHTPPGRRIAVTLDYAGGMLRLIVTNEGEPLTDEIRRNLFLPFNHPQDGKPRRGLGLGLYIASEIVRAHGGSIRGESDERGTTFTVLLPQASESGEGEASSASATEC